MAERTGSQHTGNRVRWSAAIERFTSVTAGPCYPEAVTSFEPTTAARRDPLSLQVELPLHGDFHPAGFLLRIATNSQHVLDAAAESWSEFPHQLYPCEPLQFRVVVQPGGVRCGLPRHRAQGHLYSVVSDTDNFASLDLGSLQASMFVSARTAEDHVWLRWSFVESLAYMLLAQRSVVPVHAGCVARDGRGILLCGASEAGKSTLSYACARAGWSYLSDDAVFLLPGTETPVALGRHRYVRFRPDAPRLFPELSAFVSRTRPNGKLAMEVALNELPQICSVPQTEVAQVVLLERCAGAEAALEAVAPQEILERMLADMPSYGAEVDAMHERTIARLLTLPAFRMRYGELDGAIRCLERLNAEPGRAANR